MALDATVAGASADSYLSVAAADALATASVGPQADAWSTATTDRKERCLKQATREIDDYLRSGWTRFSPSQALLFPRFIDSKGVSPKVPHIPSDIRDATFEQAAYLNKNVEVIERSFTRRARGMQSFSEPNVSGSMSEQLPSLSPRAEQILEGYRVAGGPRRMQSTRMSSGYVT